MTKDVLQPQLWTERSVDETIEVYTEWASRYDADVSSRGYHTPKRVALALLPHISPRMAPVLDFGCGTGLSGLALRASGIEPVHGTDIVQAMIDKAAPKQIYDTLWLSPPDTLDVTPGAYRAIVATGVISLGAAPAATMDLLIKALTPGDILALSFNDPTIAHGGYDAHLARHTEAGTLNVLFREHGPHLDDVGMGSDVIILSRA